MLARKTRRITLTFCVRAVANLAGRRMVHRIALGIKLLAHRALVSGLRLSRSRRQMREKVSSGGFIQIRHVGNIGRNHGVN